MKKVLAVLVGVSLLVSGLTACSGGPAKQTGDAKPAATAENKETKTPEPKKQAVTVKWMWEQKDGPGLERWVKYFVKPVEAKFPNIKIDFQPTPNHQQVIKVQIASGEGPDLFLAEPADVIEFTQAGRILELDKYVQKFGWDKIMYDWALKTMKINGKQMGIPHAYEGCLFWYNQDLLEKNGWPIPKTRAEFEKVCSEAKARNLIPIAAGYSDMRSNNMWVLSDYFSTYSGTDALKELLTGKIKFGDPRIKGAIETYVKDWQAGWHNEKQSLAIGYNDMNALWLQQKAVFLPEGTWFASGVIGDSKPKFKWGVIPWPSMKDGVQDAFSIGIGAAMAVNKNTKVADEVAEIINFMYSDEQNLANSIAEGEQTLARSINPTLYPKTIEPNVKTVLDAMSKANDEKKIGYTLWSFFPGKTTTYLYENIEKAFLGKMTVDQYLEGAQKQLDEELKAGWKFPLQ